MTVDPFYKVSDVQVINKLLNLHFEGKCLTWYLESISDVFITASNEAISNYKLSPSGYGIHWPELNEDISIHALLNEKKQIL